MNEQSISGCRSHPANLAACLNCPNFTDRTIFRFLRKEKSGVSIVGRSRNLHFSIVGHSKKTYALTFQHRMWSKYLVGNRFGDLESSIKRMYVNFYKDRGCRDSINAWTSVAVNVRKCVLVWPVSVAWFSTGDQHCPY